VTAAVKSEALFPGRIRKPYFITCDDATREMWAFRVEFLTNFEAPRLLIFA
jgi:hypothetical protein